MDTMDKPVDSFELSCPPAILFGCGRFGQLPEVVESLVGRQVSGGRCFLVCTRGFVERGGLDLLSLPRSQSPVGVFSEVRPEPELAIVDRLVGAVRAANPEVEVAVGGGSTLDVAKVAAVLAALPEAPVKPYFRGQLRIERPGLPLIAVPTTAGSGAEITRNAVLIEPETGKKQSLRSDLMTPRVALVDPELTLTLPPKATAESGMDALTQAVESFLSKRASRATMALAGTAIGLLLNHLPAAFRAGDGLPARIRVAEGSLLGAMAFAQSGLGAVHGLAHPLGVALGLPHGLVCAILLPHVLRFNAPVCEERLTRLARENGWAGPGRLLERIVGLSDELGIPSGLRGYGLRPAHFPFILENCRSNSMNCNPRPMSDAEVGELLQKLASA